MADIIGRGVIEVTADARKLRAGIEDAKRSIRTLGEGQKDISRSAQQSIDRYIGKLQQQNATFGKSVRETELFKLALRGASNEQINAANSALLIAERNAKNIASMAALRTEARAMGAAVGIALGALATGLIGAAVAFDQLIKRAGNFQDLAEKVGDSAESIAAFAVAAEVGGKSIGEIADFAIRLNKSLTGVDDDSKKAGAAIEALGLSVDKFKALKPTEQIEALAKALAGFEDTQDKGNVLEALSKGGAQFLPFLKELAGETGRVNILTEEQIRLADQYSDQQSRLLAETKLYAQAIAIDAIPSLNDLIAAFRDTLKEISGVSDGATALGRNTGIQSFADSTARVFAFVVDAADGVVRAFQLVGKSIATFAATSEQLLQLNFRGALAAFTAAAEDINSVATREFLGQKLDARIAARTSGGATAPSRTAARRDRIRFSGAEKKTRDTSADAEARAQLQFDLDQIKKAGDARIKTISDSERVLEALRRLALEDERQSQQKRIANDKEYFEQKKIIINAIAAEEEKALEEQIARLQRETFTGKNAAKERLDNERKIADLRAEIAKVRATAETDITLNALAEVSASRKIAEETKKIAQAYDDAKAAADAYIASIERRNQVELAGIGRGRQFREIMEGRTQIEERFVERRLELERDLRNGLLSRDVFEAYLRTAQETYSREVILYDERTEKLLAAQRDWTVGASEALQNYVDESRNVARQTEEIFTNAFQSLEDAIVEFATNGEFSLKSFENAARSILSDITRSLVKQSITGPLAESLKGIIPGIGTLAGGGAGGSAAADGAAFSTQIAASAATFSATVTAAATAEGAALSAGITSAGTLFSTEISTAGVTFAAAVTEAGAAFAAVVNSASAGGGASGLFDILGSFQSGTNYVPKTGLYQLHEGERVVSKSQNRAGGGVNISINQSFAPGTDSRTLNQGAVRTGQAVQRAMARFT